MKIGIIVAMDKEFAQLEKVFQNDENIIIQKCGIGKVNSTVGATKMISEHHPDLIISTGCAGGADTTLNVGDVVVAEECTYHDAYCGDECEFGQILGMPARFKSPEYLVDVALGLNHGELKIKKGLTVSGEWFVDSREKMQQIMDKFPNSTAVDMESCSIAQTCHIFDTPFISFRIISDVPLKDNKAQMYFDFWDRMAEGSFEVTKSFIDAINK
ncbi:MAG: 5'-methylthioadenosine/S-adenosylhomocysteine nucleosidase [Prevotella sp.]|jgi:adenosylhomocysteine nucleosidase|nr:5'-methylthioadenosine/S-adenosylhomocysteine nucleosidase [Prevotella sp.]MBP8686512.1 5'-methylthioadenosine/S-adenosylhomocysteine nucleosidase [Prevotella sp.]